MNLKEENCGVVTVLNISSATASMFSLEISILVWDDFLFTSYTFIRVEFKVRPNVHQKSKCEFSRRNH